jgi:hypothetical protein
MSAPNGPHIKTTYKKDGTMVQEPTGFGGKLCEIATKPYHWRQGYGTSRPTVEADEPTMFETEKVQQRETA